jgi:hypothetical protein
MPFFEIAANKAGLHNFHESFTGFDKVSASLISPE